MFLYLTNYRLTVRNIKNTEQFKELLSFMRKKELINYAFDDGYYNIETKEAVFLPWGHVEWYNHVTDMIQIAEKFPDMYFQLDGIGESFEDVWRQYYHDMDIEACSGEIIFEKPKKVQWTELVGF